MFKVLICIILLGLLACTKKTSQEEPNKQLSIEELAQRGKSIYMTNCIACHNVDPSKEGSMGPAVKDSSLELLQAKVLKNTYPPRYSAKRSTSQMVALPHLEKEIPAIHAFLNKME